MRPPRKGFQYREMAGLRFVETGKGPVNETKAPFRRNHEFGPTLGGDQLAVDIRRAFKRPHRRRCDGDRPATSLPRAVYRVSRLLRGLIPLRGRRHALLQPAYPP